MGGANPRKEVVSSRKGLSWAGTKQELRSQRSEVRIGNYRVAHILFSVFCFLCLLKTSRGFGVWLKPDYLSFLKEDYYV